MSRRAAWVSTAIWVSIMVALMAPAGGSAQAGPEATNREQALMDAIEVLRPRLEAAERHAAEMRVLEQAAEEADRLAFEELRVGPLTIYAEPERADEARALFEEAWSEFEAWSDVEMPPELTRFTYHDRLRQRPVVIDGVETTHVVVSPYRGQALRRRRVRDAIGHGVSGLLSHPAKSWIHNAPIYGQPDERQGGDMFRELLLTPSRATAECRTGSIDACRAAFGLSDSPDPMGEWYDPAQVEHLAAERFERDFNCAPANSLEDCRAWLDEGTHWTQSVPLVGNTRAHLVALAIERGGEGSVERFLADWSEPTDSDSNGWTGFRSELVAHLEAAAAEPLDDLLAAWRDQVMAARPDDREEGRDDHQAAFLWILFFAFFATRSSRCRLG